MDNLRLDKYENMVDENILKYVKSYLKRKRAEKNIKKEIWDNIYKMKET